MSDDQLRVKFCVGCGEELLWESVRCSACGTNQDVVPAKAALGYLPLGETVLAGASSYRAHHIIPWGAAPIFITPFMLNFIHMYCRALLDKKIQF